LITETEGYKQALSDSRFEISRLKDELGVRSNETDARVAELNRMLEDAKAELSIVRDSYQGSAAESMRLDGEGERQRREITRLRQHVLDNNSELEDAMAQTQTRAEEIKERKVLTLTLTLTLIGGD